jgi:hypothetical protein
MTDEKWKEVIAKIKDNFELVDHQTEELIEESGPGSVEIIEFIGPLGRMKLERVTRPLVIDKKTIGSKRIGSNTTVEYIYSDTEKVNKFKAYRFDDKDQVWVEMEMERSGMFF